MALARDRIKPKQQLNAVAINESANDMISEKDLLVKLVDQGKRIAICTLVGVPLAFGSAGCQPNVKGDTSSLSERVEGGDGGGDGGGGGGSGGGGDGGGGY